MLLRSLLHQSRQTVLRENRRCAGRSGLDPVEQSGADTPIPLFHPCMRTNAQHRNDVLGLIIKHERANHDAWVEPVPVGTEQFALAKEVQSGHRKVQYCQTV